jgi:hypothetical protein
MRLKYLQSGRVRSVVSEVVSGSGDKAGATQADHGVRYLQAFLGASRTRRWLFIACSTLFFLFLPLPLRYLRINPPLLLLFALRICVRTTYITSVVTVFQSANQISLFTHSRHPTQQSDDLDAV